MAAEVQLFDDLDAVAADARGALDRAAQASLFDRLDWFRLTLAHCPPPGRLLVARARDGDAATWVFLVVDRGRAQALASWYTLRFDAVHQGEATPEILAAIARALRKRRPRIHHLTLAPLADRELIAAFAAAGWIASATETTSNWSIAITPEPSPLRRQGPMSLSSGVTAESDSDGLLPPPERRTAAWDAYWSARPKRLRETVRRRARDPLDIAIHTAFDPAAWSAYEQVYRASWKPEEGSWPFLRALAEREGTAGTLRLGIACVPDGAPVAAQLWLTERGTATIHKLAHVEAAREGSPGTLLSHAMFRHAIAVDGVARIDFGTGDDAYKADWTDTRAPLFRLDAWNPATMRGIAGAARARVGALVRRVVKV